MNGLLVLSNVRTLGKADVSEGYDEVSDSETSKRIIRARDEAHTFCGIGHIHIFHGLETCLMRDGRSEQDR